MDIGRYRSNALNWLSLFFLLMKIWTVLLHTFVAYGVKIINNLSLFMTKKLIISNYYIIGQKIFGTGLISDLFKDVTTKRKVKQMQFVGSTSKVPLAYFHSCQQTVSHSP